MKVLNIHSNYSLLSEEGQSKPSNLGQTEVQQWNQTSTKYNSSIHHAFSCLPVAECESRVCACASSTLMKSLV